MISKIVKLYHVTIVNKGFQRLSFIGTQQIKTLMTEKNERHIGYNLIDNIRMFEKRFEKLNFWFGQIIQA